MRFQTFFDASNKLYNWQPLVLSGFLIFALLFLLVLSIFARGEYRELRKILIAPCIFGLVICSTWAFLAFNTTYNQYKACQDALKMGKYNIVEGSIRDLKPSSDDKGRLPEAFTVGNVAFAYKDSIASCGYTTTTNGNGPIQNGVYVRISYLTFREDNVILRIEIREP
jgi:hypothetical protein